jgi:hypothetical protein
MSDNHGQEDGAHPLARAIGADLVRTAVGSVPVIGRALEGVVDIVQDIRSTRVREYASHVQAQEPDLLRKLETDPKAADLFEHGARAAADARSSAKVRALALVVGSRLGATNIAFDYAHFLLNAMQPLEDVHVAVMDWLGDIDKDPDDRYAVAVQGGERSIGRLVAERPGLSDVAGPVMASLVGQGLVENSAPGAVGGVGEAELWTLTSLGRWILDYLRVARTEELQADLQG